MTAPRAVERIVRAHQLLEGAGVKVRRTIALPMLDHLDPFLLLDHFESDDPEDYVRGFPTHPHRGIETVTYMLDGRVRHEDSIGNRGVIGPGDVQWMTAGRGIVHSEMPERGRGLLRGFQLWVNLPARHKMVRPRYQDVPAGSIPLVENGGSAVRVVAGTYGDARGPVTEIVTSPLYVDVHLDPGASISIPLPRGHTAFVYVFEGEARIGETAVGQGSLAVLGDGEGVQVGTGDGARLILAAGKPLGEPIARWGPFVMNTEQEIEQAIADYRNGALVAPD